MEEGAPLAIVQVRTRIVSVVVAITLAVMRTSQSQHNQMQQRVMLESTVWSAGQYLISDLIGLSNQLKHACTSSAAC